MTIEQALAWAEAELKSADIPSARLDSQLLLAFVIRQERSWLLANDDQRISDSEQ